MSYDFKAYIAEQQPIMAAVKTPTKERYHWKITAWAALSMIGVGIGDPSEAKRAYENAMKHLEVDA